MSDYAEWDAASVDLASEIVKEHGRKIEGAALVNLRQTDEGTMQLDPLYVGERLTVVFEAIGDDKVRVNASSWSDAVVIRAEEALEVLAIGKRLFICRGERPASYLNLDMTGMTDAGYGPATK